MTEALPLPPLEMRRLVGPLDDADFDNPTGDPTFPALEPGDYAAVLDWGCGCGRLARRLIQQSPRPGRYLGLDLHRGMVQWCQQNLAPHAPGFEFGHHDVFELAFNPDATERWLPFPADADSFSLVIAWSVFTHVNEEQATRYLEEVARVLRPDGTLLSTWFLFDKREFPMMQPFQNALFVNDVNPTNAVIFDREWLVETARKVGLVIVRVDQPAMRGFQWDIYLKPRASNAVEVAIPPDRAPYGAWIAPPLAPDQHLIGLSTPTTRSTPTRKPGSGGGRPRSRGAEAP
jgi:SAM-dependent methyltransferase